MRSKEQAHDYRYFPEPDLLPLVVDEKWKAEIARALPELPEARRARMVKDYGITEYDAQVLTFSKSLADQFEAGGEGGEESQARRQPGAERVDGPPEGQGHRDRAIADFDAGRGGLGRSGRGRHDLRQDAQRSLRPHASSAAKISPRSTKKKAARSSPPTPRRWKRSSTKSWPPIPSSSSSTAPERRPCSASSSARS